MNILSKLMNLFFDPAPVGISNNLKNIIDKYNFAAILLSYDSGYPTILYTNKAHKKLTGYKNEELVGKSCRIFQGNNTPPKIVKEVEDSLKKGKFWHGNILNYHKNGASDTIEMTIFAICFEGKKYYVALKNSSK